MGQAERYEYKQTTGDKVFGVVAGLGTTLFWGAIVLGGVAGCTNFNSNPGESTDPKEVKDYQTAAVACQMPSLPVPNRANMGVVNDPRINMIYSCNYFGDMKIPINKEAGLGEIKEETFDRNISDAKVEGSIGGFAILATGILSGRIDGSSHSEDVRERLYLVNIQDENGNYIFTTLDKADKVRIKRCDSAVEACKPSIKFVTSNQPLWYKEPGVNQTFPLADIDRDTSSIWSKVGVRHKQSFKDARRENVVSLLVGGDGAPLPAGQVAAELSEEIIITVPN